MLKHNLNTMKTHSTKPILTLWQVVVKVFLLQTYINPVFIVTPFYSEPCTTRRLSCLLYLLMKTKNVYGSWMLHQFPTHCRRRWLMAGATLLKCVITTRFFYVKLIQSLYYMRQVTVFHALLSPWIVSDASFCNNRTASNYFVASCGLFPRSHLLSFPVRVQHNHVVLKHLLTLPAPS